MAETTGVERGRLIERLAELVGDRAAARMVFGDPVERGNVTVVPVARVGYGFGGGSGRKPQVGAIGTVGTEEEEGAGGGAGVKATPAGFLVIRDDDATFRQIRDPARLAGLILAIGAGLWLTMRGFARLARAW